MCEDLARYRLSRLERRLGTLKQDLMNEIKRALAFALDFWKRDFYSGRCAGRPRGLP
jgi:hypothetical protein